MDHIYLYSQNLIINNFLGLFPSKIVLCGERTICRNHLKSMQRQVEMSDDSELALVPLENAKTK